MGALLNGGTVASGVGSVLPTPGPDADAVTLTHVRKQFEQTVALNDVSLSFRAGEIHALCGQNGSGKSTLVKLLTGVHPADSGTITIWGADAENHVRPLDHGIAVIHQNLALVEDLTVAENFGVTESYGVSKRRRLISWRRERELLSTYAAEFGVHLDPSQPVATLRPAHRAVLAIMRALRDLAATASGSRQLLILDEPTTYLPVDEKERLAQIMKSLAGRGVGILIVSHELDYVLNIADRVSVLRDGAAVITAPAQTLDKEKVVLSMIGRSLTRFYPPRRPRAEGPVLLNVEGLTGRLLHPLSFELRSGEILGITGLAGGGQEEIPYLIHEATAHHRPAVQFPPSGTGTQPDHAVAVVPANREHEGIWSEGTAAENLTIASLNSFVRHGALNKRLERRVAQKLLAEFDVRPVAPTKPIHEFSGGNQQKIVLARWLSSESQILLLHEPVQGIDIAANAAIFDLIVAAAARGVGVLICSNEWEQLANLCNRVLALRDGRLVGELDGDELTEGRLAILCQSSSEATGGVGEQ